MRTLTEPTKRRGSVGRGRTYHAVADRWLHALARWLRQPRYTLPLLFVLFIQVRLMGLDATLTADEGYWVQRTLRFGAALARGDLDSTYRSGHPGVTVMWIGLLGIGPSPLAPLMGPAPVTYDVVELAPGYVEGLGAGRRAIVVATAALLVAIVGILWKLLGAGPALVSGALLLLDPYLAGMTRLLHPDALLAPLMLVALLAALVFWTQGGARRYLVLSAGMTGLALLTKAPAVVLLPAFGLLGLDACRARRRWRGWPGPVLTWSGLAALTVFLCWPALWVNASARLNDVVEFVTQVGGQPHRWPTYFLGQPVSGDPGPLFYPVALVVRLSPVVMVGLIELAVVGCQRRYVPPAVRGLIGFALLFVMVMTLGPKKLDRYLLPALLALQVLAGVGLWWLAQRLWSWRWRAILFLVAIGTQATLFLHAAPYLISAYNPLIGGTRGASQLVLVGWGEGLERAADYLNALPDAEHLVATTHYHDVLRPLFRGTTVRMGGREHLDYSVVYINMLQRDRIPRALRATMATERPVFTVSLHGEPYAAIYRMRADLQQQSNEGPSETEEFEDEQD